MRLQKRSKILCIHKTYLKPVGAFKESVIPTVVFS